MGKQWDTSKLLEELDKVTKADIVNVAKSIELDTVYFLNAEGGQQIC